jgi:hypothetical protein
MSFQQVKTAVSGEFWRFMKHLKGNFSGVVGFAVKDEAHPLCHL